MKYNLDEKKVKSATRQTIRPKSRSRELCAFFQMNNNQVILFFIMAILGVIAVFFVRSINMTNEADVVYNKYVEAENKLKEERQENEALLKRQRELETRRKSLLYALNNNPDNKDVFRDLDKYRLHAGLADVKGPGIIISLRDKRDYNPLTDNRDALIHDGTINYIINLLSGAGAQAISLNGTRLSTVPRIYCIGPTILCYSRRLAPPYVIAAIGPIEAMTEVIGEDSFIQHITTPQVGLRFDFQVLDQITINSFSRYEDYESHISFLEVPRNEK